MRTAAFSVVAMVGFDELHIYYMCFEVYAYIHKRFVQTCFVQLLTRTKQTGGRASNPAAVFHLQYRVQDPGQGSSFESLFG